MRCIFIWIALHNVFICKMHTTILSFGAFCYWIFVLKPFRKFRTWSRLDIHVTTVEIDTDRQHKTNQSNPRLGVALLVKTDTNTATKASSNNINSILFLKIVFILEKVFIETMHYNFKVRN